MDSLQLKEEGNKHFKAGSYEDALTCYTQALEISDTDNPADRAVFYKNKAACHLKLNNPQLAANDASKALDIQPNDTKSLFRRCQALELLGKPEEAYRDGMKLVQLEPKNKAVVPIMQRLSAYVSEKSRQMNSTDSKVSQMFEFAFDSSNKDPQKRQQALNNLLVLAREEAGAEKVFKQGGIEKLDKVLNTKDDSLVLATLRILSAMSKHSKLRTYAVLGLVGLVRIVAQFSSTNSEVCTACRSLIQSILNGISGIERYREEREKWQAERDKTGYRTGANFKPMKLEDDEKAHIDQVFHALLKAINSHKLSADGRDNILEIFINNVTSKEGFNWTRQFLETDGAVRLMEVAGMIPGRSTISVSPNTRMHCSVLLSKLWDDTMSDQQRDKVRDMCHEYFLEQFGDKCFDSKLDAIVALSCLLQGPAELGNSVLGRPGVMDILLALANSNEVDHQLIAVEALVHATSKKDKCKGIVETAIPILKELYKSSKNDNIRVRALVGMCKITSSAGTDAADKDEVAGESIMALSRACRKFLANPSKNVDLRKWAVEGLAYLTLDADVKEELTQDPDSLKALVEIAKVGDQTVLFPAASVFVNLMNAYDKPEIMPEMLKLAEYAKQKVPEEHPKDKEDFVLKRVATLMSYDVGSAAVALCKTQSSQCKELLARIFLSLSTETEHRGKLVQQGVGKVLIPLALENTDEGKHKAAQALAKLSITINPEQAFPGQRMLEVVRPLVRLLHPDRTALQTFEALLALTNITSISPSARRRVVKEKAIAEIESYMLDEHDMLKRAAVECMCNMVLDEDVASAYLEENDKVKLFTLYCGDEDYEIQRAACGALAILTSQHPKEISEKIIAVKAWKELLLQVLVSEKAELQHRATHLVMNMMNEKDIAEALVQTQLFEVLLAITKLQGPEHKSSRECAEEALEAAAKHGLAKSVK